MADKLLVLGATKMIGEIVKAAKRLGIYTYAADYYENSPAKKLADQAVLLNVVDVDKVVEFIKKENINGVLTGFADSLLPAYKEICEKANLPCYITNEEQLNFALKKEVFKSYLKEFEIPYIEDLDENTNDFPVIVKPVDNSGARGISICHNKEELKKGIELALEFSKSKKYLIEKYLDCAEATVFYLFINGKAYFTLMGDRHVAPVKEGFIKLPTGYTFPSPHTEKFKKELHPKFQKLFEKLNIQNGMMFLQCFVDKSGTIIPYEPGFRLTGSLEYILLNKVCDYNPIEMMIHFALTGQMESKQEHLKINPNVKKCYNISCLLRDGTIDQIEGTEKLKNTDGIVDVFESYEKGDSLPESVWGKLAQIGVRLFVVPDDNRHYQQLQEAIKNNLKIIDKQGQNMIINYGIKE